MKNRDENYYKAMEQTMKLHMFIRDGKENEEETNALRNAMELSWNKLTEKEQEEVNLMSAFLYEFQNFITGKQIEILQKELQVEDDKDIINRGWKNQRSLEESFRMYSNKKPKSYEK